jgi:Reverse transcriptase (RNA-dependent DNA polymerase)
LFLLLLEAVMQLALHIEDVGARLDGQIISNLRFADDIDLIAETATDLQDLTDRANNHSKRFGLKMNSQKTQVMAIGKEDTKLNIFLHNGKLDQLEEFTYSGGVFTEDGNCTADVKKRIGKAASVIG